MSAIKYSDLELWFITGSQDLYGEETLAQVAKHSKEIVDQINKAGNVPVKLVWRPVVLTSAGIAEAMRQANAESACIGVLTWMHTFSPAKMWIRGLQLLSKPLLHLHTQFNRDIPWDSIDMDFMNLNQSAHGDREFGHIGSRLGLKRKVIAGFWKEQSVQNEIGQWARSAVGLYDMQNLKVARFGDNMRQVSVTEGDKVEAQIALGVEVNGYSLGDLTGYVDAVSKETVDGLFAECSTLYTIDKATLANEEAVARIKEQLQIESGIRSFLEDGGFNAFTTTFENLTGLPQLPGLAAQRLMADGYGFGAEGDWKHSAMVRVVKTMAQGLPGGNSFMEDYTYHMEGGNQMVLGAHMLEICPSIAVQGEKPRLEVHPLGIGGKADPARLVFDGQGGDAINVSLVDMGDRLRLIVNEVQAKQPDKAMPNLPVARVLWKPLPDFRTALEGWILAGGAHHTVFTTSLKTDDIENFARMAGIELIRIGEGSSLRELEKDLLLSDLAAKR